MYLDEGLEGWCAIRVLRLALPGGTASAARSPQSTSSQVVEGDVRVEEVRLRRSLGFVEVEGLGFRFRVWGLGCRSRFRSRAF